MTEPPFINKPLRYKRISKKPPGDSNFAVFRCFAILYKLTDVTIKLHIHIPASVHNTDNVDRLLHLVRNIE